MPAYTLPRTPPVVTVTATPTSLAELLEYPTAFREGVVLQAASDNDQIVYLGNATVTGDSDAMFEFPAGGTGAPLVLPLVMFRSLYAVSASGSQRLRVLPL